MRGLQYLESLPMWRAGAFSPLDIPKKILLALDNPQDKFKTIHVAGTNGKGTTCAAITALLTAAGKKTGFFSSPHLIDVTERCRINNQPISREKLDYYLCKVAQIVSWDTSAMTYFVAVTCASFLCFAEQKVDYAVIEVGLGGKFDATNLILKPELALITNIDFDHQELLGSSLASIAENKAGIIKPNCKVLLGELKSEASDVVLKIASQNNAEVYYSKKINIKAKNELMRSAFGQAAGQLALVACEILNIKADIESIESLSWPGRLQLIELEDGKKFLIDGAHNVAGFKVLFDHLQDLVNRFNFKHITLLIGLKQRTGWQESVVEIKQNIEKLEEKHISVNINLINWDQGVENLTSFFDISASGSIINLLKHTSAELTVVTGSLYVIGEAITFLKRPNSLI